MVRAHEEAADQLAARGGRTPHRAAPAPTAGVSGVPMTPATVLALQGSAGNAAVQRVVARDTHQHGPGCGHTVQRRTDPEAHQHGAGCGHDGIDDRSPEGQHQLLKEAKESPSSSLPGSFLDKAVPFYDNPALAGARMYTGPVAQRATAAMGAEAMTIGMDVFLGPSAIGNEEILAHEASHLDKNSRGITETGSGSGGSPAVTDPGQSSEVAAVNDGAAFKAGHTAAPSVVAQRAVAHDVEDAD
ncbi:MULTISPECIES: eCIS core domain-containing protein [Streptomyces]|uniref:eCIS core domain-containing protein n=1 Tax=Streptomyces TaxID=1883 RepID=UPI003799F08B